MSNSSKPSTSNSQVSSTQYIGIVDSNPGSNIQSENILKMQKKISSSDDNPKPAKPIKGKMFISEPNLLNIISKKQILQSTLGQIQEEDLPADQTADPPADQTW